MKNWISEIFCGILMAAMPFLLILLHNLVR